jgi:hypothetical protein
MRHVPDGQLRRLVDEPFAVSDTDTGHVASCDRCRRRHHEIKRNAAEAAVMLSRPHSVPDLEAAWRNFSPTVPAPDRPVHTTVRAHRRVVTVTLPSPRVMVAAAVLVAAAATAGTLAAVQSPSSPPPQKASAADFQAIEDLAGLSGGHGTLGGSGILGGFDTASGERQLPFGVLRWSSSGAAHSVPSLAAATAATGLELRPPARLPAGVGAISSILVQPRVTVTIRFGAAAGALAGNSLTVSAGPAVVVEYGAETGELAVPTLATFTMERPTVPSRTATATQLEAYVLAAPGVPSGLDQELRLLGDMGTVLPFQAPPGTNASQVDVDGAAGILVTAPTIGGSGVIWVRDDLVHVAVGLLDGNGVLNVARQIG